MPGKKISEYNKMHMSEDTVTEILIRLPVRSLIRFKCVCKTWNSLIKSPPFVEMHLALQLTRDNQQILHCSHPCLVSCFDDYDSLRFWESLPSFKVPGFIDSDRQAKFAGHSNGLVCITDYRSNITLWNPALREFKVLPKHDDYWVPSGYNATRFAIGFGFDDVTNDYKVVSIEVNLNNKGIGPEIVVAHVYNLKTNFWRRLANPPEYIGFVYAPVGPPIFFNGFIHWCVMRYMDPGRRRILTFNLTTELFQEMQCPRGCEEYPFVSLSDIFIFDKCTIALVLVVSAQNICDVWVMKDYNVVSSWTKQYSIEFASLIYRPLSFWKRDQLLLITTDGLLSCYDLPTGQFHQLWQYDKNLLWSYQIVICVESLVSIRSNDE